MTGADDFRRILDDIRLGTELGEGGKTVRRPSYLVNRNVWKAVRDFLVQRGEFFRAPVAYYFDRTDGVLIRLTEGDPHFGGMLRKLGLLPRETHTLMIKEGFMDHGNASEMKVTHKLAYMSKHAIYLQASPTRMWRITVSSFTEVPLGTDDVFLLSNDLGELPHMELVKQGMNRLRDQVGCTTTGLLEGLPCTS